MLRKIECYIQPFKLDPLTEALVELGVDGMSVTEVRGFGRQRGHVTEGPSGAPHQEGRARAPGKAGIKFLTKLKLEIVVREDMVDATVALITKLARTGTVGAGKIFILPVEDAIRIGTGEAGRTAIA